MQNLTGPSQKRQQALVIQDFHKSSEGPSCAALQETQNTTYLNLEHVCTNSHKDILWSAELFCGGVTGLLHKTTAILFCESEGQISRVQIVLSEPGKVSCLHQLF